MFWTFELLTDLGGSTWRDTIFLYNLFVVTALYYLNIWRRYQLFPYKKLLIGTIENQGYCGFLNSLEVALCSSSLFASQSWSLLRIYWPLPSVYFFQSWPHIVRVSSSIKLALLAQYFANILKLQPKQIHPVLQNSEIYSKENFDKIAIW